MSRSTDIIANVMQSLPMPFPLQKRNILSSEQHAEVKRTKRSGQYSGKLFPKICMICKSAGPKKVKGDRQKIKVVQTTTACNTLQLAATTNSDDEMLLAITGGDLIAKEFQYHEKCYQNYVRDVSKPSKSEAKDDPISSAPNSLEKLRKFVQDHVIEGGQNVSVKLLTEVYGFNSEDSRLRNKVKKKLSDEFDDQIYFVQTFHNEAEIAISQRSLSNTSVSTFMKGNNEFILKEAAAILREDAIKMIQASPELCWPPTTEALTAEERQPPETVINFFTDLLHSPLIHHPPGEEVKRYVSSFSQDLLHAISKGKFMTAKHTLIGTALHSITGQKLPIQILSKYGNSCNYETVQKIETAQAELVQKMRQQNYPLPLLPANSTSSVLTFFWWDNFDCKKETIYGGIHTCHGIAFQEKSDGSKLREDLAINIPSSSRKTVSVIPQTLPKKAIKSHVEPAQFSSKLTSNINEKSYSMLFLWKLLRLAHSCGNQEISRFVGWVILICGSRNSSATILTFLPPILNPITEYSTVIECIYQSQKLANASNMKYAHITTDAGAAAKFFHVLWNYPAEFKNVIIHLGDLHGFMEFFGIIGKIIQGSGFEEIVYQANLCTSGSLQGVLSGKHYNRSWLINECFSEAIERLFCQAYVNESTDSLSVAEESLQHRADCEAYLNGESYINYEKKYEEQKLMCLDGQYGKTPQFWMKYVQLVDRQHLLHYAINTNDFEERLQCWKDSIALCFSCNKQNYSRYGAYYCLLLENLENTHPGATEELKVKGLSVCQNTVNIGQSIDGAGEQTFMKSSKTTGEIIFEQ